SPARRGALQQRIEFDREARLRLRWLFRTPYCWTSRIHASVVSRWPIGQRPTANGELDMIRRMFVVYEVLLYLVFILALPFFLLTGLLRGKYLTNFPQRMGFYRTPAVAHDLWIHAVSVGETLASRAIIDEVLRRRPDTSIVFTTTTI